jgi:hypothetical protein
MSSSSEAPPEPSGDRASGVRDVDTINVLVVRDLVPLTGRTAVDVPLAAPPVDVRPATIVDRPTGTQDVPVAVNEPETDAGSSGDVRTVTAVNEDGSSTRDAAD